MTPVLLSPPCTINFGERTVQLHVAHHWNWPLSAKYSCFVCGGVWNNNDKQKLKASNFDLNSSCIWLLQATEVSVFHLPISFQMKNSWHIHNDRQSVAYHRSKFLVCEKVTGNKTVSIQFNNSSNPSFPCTYYNLLITTPLNLLDFWQKKITAWWWWNSIGLDVVITRVVTTVTGLVRSFSLTKYTNTTSAYDELNHIKSSFSSKHVRAI